MKYRVIFSEHDIRRLDVMLVDTDDVGDFVRLVAEKLNIVEEFKLQYADPDFNNEFCNVENMLSLQTTNTLKIVMVPRALDRSSQSAPEEQSSSSSATLRVCSELPKPYNLPDFDLQTKLLLQNKQKVFTDTGALFLPAKNEKGKILSTLCEDIYKYKSYPNDTDCAAVSKALIAAYPCLKEKGGPLGYEAWKNSLKFKMSSLRANLSRSGVLEASANVGRKSKYQTTGTPPAKDIKKARRSEANYLPSLPDGETATMTEENVDILKDEMQKVINDKRLISSLMSKTFAQRRMEIVGTTPRPLISVVAARWPALFLEVEVHTVSCNITNKIGHVCNMRYVPVNIMYNLYMLA